MLALVGSGLYRESGGLFIRKPIRASLLENPMNIATFTSLEGMDSRDIAQVANKAHRNVCRDIEEQIGKLEGGVLRFEHTYRNAQNGQSYRCYVLPKRECLILATGYDVVLRAKLVDRWAELESGAAAPIGREKDFDRAELEGFKAGMIFYRQFLLEATKADSLRSQPRTNRIQPAPTYHAKGEGLFPVKIAPWTHPKIEDAKEEILAMPAPLSMVEIFKMLKERGVLRNLANEMAVAFILKESGLYRRRQYRVGGGGCTWVYERI